MKQRLQGVVIGIVITALMLSTTTTLATSTRRIDVTYGVNIVVNGIPQNLTGDLTPFISGGRTFLPVSGIANILGVDVEWDYITSTVFIHSATALDPVYLMPQTPPTSRIPPTNQNSEPTPEHTQQPTAVAPPPITLPATTSGINAGTFALLRNGMSISEVQNIIGVEHSSEITTEAFGITTTIKVWMNTQNFSSISVIFTDGHATAISQIGL